MKLEFDVFSKISSEQAEVILDLILKKYKEDTLIKEYIKNKEIMKCSKFMFPIGDIDLLDVFRNVDTIFELSGENKIFGEMTKRLEDKITDAESFVNTHKNKDNLLNLYYSWTKLDEGWINNPNKDLEKRMHAIMAINRALEHNVFNSDDVKILCQILELKK